MGAYNLKDQKAKNCDNKATIRITIGDNGGLFITQRLGGADVPVGNNPYGPGSEDIKADIGTILTLKPVAAPGFKSDIGRGTTFRMGKKEVVKHFTFKCKTC